MNYAICIRCGQPKKRSNGRCPNCKFVPKSDHDLAKSMILSLSYQVGERDLSKSWDELLDIGRLIERGGYEFDEKEVDWIAKEAQMALNLPVMEQIKFIGTPYLFIAIMIFIVIILSII